MILSKAIDVESLIPECNQIRNILERGYFSREKVRESQREREREREREKESMKS